jgi:hypothetical protein
MDDTVHAYTREEWGIGGSQPFGNYSVHTLPGTVAALALMIVPAIVSPVMFLIALIRLNLGVALLSLFCTVLFTGGWLLTLAIARKELTASKLRDLKGLPKPRFSVTDDQARFWFEKNPGLVSITPENFPDSTLPFPTEDVPE